MNDFGQTLKHWRARRRLSQLDLAIEAGISSRHLSFLETGRANPSRDMVIRLGETLDLPLEARNRLMAGAGFAVRYEARGWDEADMLPVRTAIARMLDTHMPYPGLAVDRLWTVRMANAAALSLFGALGVGIGDSLLDLMTSPVLPQVVENWPDVAHHVALRLRTESAASGGIPELDRVVAQLDRVPGPRDPARTPVIPTVIRLGDRRLSFFTTIAQFGTPEDLALDSLKIELYFPMDVETASACEDIARAARGETG